MVFNDGTATSRRNGFPAVKSIAEQENTINKSEPCVTIIKCVANIRIPGMMDSQILWIYSIY